MGIVAKTSQLVDMWLPRTPEKLHYTSFSRFQFVDVSGLGGRARLTVVLLLLLALWFFTLHISQIGHGALPTSPPFFPNGTLDAKDIMTFYADDCLGPG